MDYDDDDDHELQELEDLAEWEQLLEVQSRLVLVRRDPFQYYSEDEFVQHYGFSKMCVKSLLEKIQHNLPTSRCRRGLRIPPKLQLLVTLRYITTGSIQKTSGNYTDMSQSSASNCVKNAAAAIAQLAPEYIKFPDPSEEESLMKQFAGHGRMPGVIGCVDGMHVPIKGPGRTVAEEYMCENNSFHSLNVMGVCDPNLKFTCFLVDSPGSVHDSVVFSDSKLRAQLETGCYKGFLLGDSDYECLPYLLTPIVAPQTDKERHYNDSHAKTRSLIEQSFEILRRRFPLLTKPMMTKITNTKNIILACGVLHNIGMTDSPPIDKPDCFGVLAPEISSNTRKNTVLSGEKRRAHIVEQYF